VDLYDIPWLNNFWFLVLGVLLSGYGILDGFDLGVGILHLNVRKDEERRILMNSIGPIWDGNEVWLVVLGGAVFAAFPNAYATVFSGLYLPFMLILFGLIFRAVSLEFRSKQESRAWRAFWDYAFFVASTSVTFLFGVLVGTTIDGLPIKPLPPDGQFEFVGTLADVFTPYSILTGLFAVATFAMHGSIYLYLKTEGALQQRIHGWMWTTFGIFLIFYMLTTIFTLTTVEASREKYVQYPWLGIVVVLNVLAIANIPRAIYLNRPFYAFLSSSATIAAFTFLFGSALYPNLAASSIDPAFNLTVVNSASSPGTLWLMAIIAMLGMPFVLAYTASIYWLFRGKVKLTKVSY
jgi:cytochrome bd ubiquinol oxidase subunit II